MDDVLTSVSRHVIEPIQILPMDAKDGMALLRLRGGCAFRVGSCGIFDRRMCGPISSAFLLGTMGPETDYSRYRASTTSGRRGKATSSTSTERNGETRGSKKLGMDRKCKERERQVH